METSPKHIAAGSSVFLRVELSHRIFERKITQENRRPELSLRKKGKGKGKGKNKGKDDGKSGSER